MVIELYGVPYGRSHDAEWYSNPHEAIEAAGKAGKRRVIRLTHDTDLSRANQTILTIEQLRRRLGQLYPDWSED